MTQLDSTFAALAHPRRRAILARLMKGETTVMEIARPFHMSLPAVSKHIGVLEDAGLVRRHRRGREHWISLNAGPMREAISWIEGYRKFWEAQLDSLEEYLNKSTGKGETDDTNKNR